MDHREQMQQEAERWQKTSVKLIQSVRYGVLILGIVVVLILFARNLGFPQEVNETLPALVIMEDGQTLECVVEIQGEVTNYPLNKDKFGIDDSVTIYANGNRILLVSYNGDKSTGFIFTQNQNAICAMAVQRNVVLLETDVQNIFPQMEGQRCLLATGAKNSSSVWEEAASYSLPGEFLEQFTFFQK